MGRLRRRVSCLCESSSDLLTCVTSFWASLGVVGFFPHFVSHLYLRRLLWTAERFCPAATHPNRKDKFAASVHPTDEDLSVGAPGWGARPYAAVEVPRGGYRALFPDSKLVLYRCLRCTCVRSNGIAGCGAKGRSEERRLRPFPHHDPQRLCHAANGRAAHDALVVVRTGGGEG